MSKIKDKTTSVLKVLILIMSVLILLKLAGLINVSWSLIFSPILIPLFVIGGILLALVVIYKITKNK